MNKKSVYNLFYTVAVVLLLSWFFVTIKQVHTWGGWLLMLFFFSLAVAFRGNRFLKGLSYTVMIIGVVSFAMYHPEYFKTIGSFKLSSLIIPFGMRTTLAKSLKLNSVPIPNIIIWIKVVIRVISLKPFTSVKLAG